MSQVDKIDILHQQLTDVGYIADYGLATSIFFMKELKRPLFLEGGAGVGKTQLSESLAEIFDTELIRLQCYEGLDIHNAAYEWNYQRQLLSIQYQYSNTNNQNIDKDLFNQKFLLERPLLKAIRQPKPVVLLIDEIDKADEQFEAYLLEILSNFQITIPELGTIKATTKPYVILTSNRNREISDALLRRCLYQYIEYPNFTNELRIVNSHLPNLSQKLAHQIVSFIQNLRRNDLNKKPGISETIDWAHSLLSLKINSLDDNLDIIKNSLICLIKTKEDIEYLDNIIIERLIAQST